MQGQVALVTGASRGIGQAIARSLAQAGATVVGTATSEAGAEKISAWMAADGLQGHGICLNVNDSAQIMSVLSEISAQHGAVSILVNNAGITRDTLLMRMKEEQWDEVLETNLKSAFRLSQAVMRDMMKARYGRIVNIASVVGVMGNAGQTNYAAAKAGLIGFSKSLAKELGARGVTVNCVAPGFIQTDMTDVLSTEQKAALLAHIPAGRLGSVEDIAEAVRFLASPAAGYITGSTLHVNGGMYMD